MKFEECQCIWEKKEHNVLLKYIQTHFNTCVYLTLSYENTSIRRLFFFLLSFLIFNLILCQSLFLNEANYGISYMIHEKSFENLILNRPVLKS